MKQNEYIIQNQVYTQEQIEKLSLAEWAVNRIINMPKSLVKYFPNVIDEETGRNYSLEALENNTVYLQSPDKFDDVYDCSIVFDEDAYSFARLRYYASYCGFAIEDNDYWKFIYAFAQKIYEKVIKLQQCGVDLENALKQVFKINEDGTSKNKTHLMFVLGMVVELNSNSAQDVWQIAFAKALKAEISLIRKTLIENFRIACFSTSPYMNRMWASQYANNHKGFCIEYKIPEYSKEYLNIFHNLFPVIYSDVRTSVLNECLKYIEDKKDTQLIEDIYKYGVLTKSKDWMEQDEWRLVSMGTILADDYNCKFFPIQKVYLGNKMENEERKKVIEICKRKGITYSGIIRLQDRFELTSCACLCEQCPRLN